MTSIVALPAGELHAKPHVTAANRIYEPDRSPVRRPAGLVEHEDYAQLQQVVKAWRSVGLTVFQFAPGNF
jgi:hypothetical protein